MDSVGRVLTRSLLVELDSISARSNIGKLHAYDPEIDRTNHKLIRSLRSSEVANSSHSHTSSVFASDSTILKFNGAGLDFDLADSDSSLGLCILKFSLDNIADNNSTLKELTIPYIILRVNLGDDPQKHLKEFHVVCPTMRQHGVLKDYIKMKAFPFSLDEATKDWLYLQPTLFNT
ncbi:hypothetical protein CR513_18809, partial [Mucuna pruriens]